MRVEQVGEQASWPMDRLFTVMVLNEIRLLRSSITGQRLDLYPMPGAAEIDGDDVTTTTNGNTTTKHIGGGKSAIPMNEFDDWWHGRQLEPAGR